MQSGIYPLKESNQDPRLSYCDMTQQGYFNDALEIPIGMLEIFSGSGRVIFAATRKDGYVHDGEVITFDTKIIDTANAFDANTGVLKVPVSGTYFFSASSGNEPGGSYEYVYFYINDKLDDRVLRWDYDDNSIMGSSWTAMLKTGDEVKLSVVAGTLYAAENYKIKFSGYLLKEA